MSAVQCYVYYVYVYSPMLCLLCLQSNAMSNMSMSTVQCYVYVYSPMLCLCLQSNAMSTMSVCSLMLQSQTSLRQGCARLRFFELTTLTRVSYRRELPTSLDGIISARRPCFIASSLRALSGEGYRFRFASCRFRSEAIGSSE